MDDLRAQARQKRQRMSFEIVQAALSQCALPLVVDMNEQVARAACMLDVPHQFMAGRRVEETPQCKIEPRRKPAEICLSSRPGGTRWKGSRAETTTRAHARACPPSKTHSDEPASIGRILGTGVTIDLRNMEQGATSKVDHRPALGRIADFQDVVSGLRASDRLRSRSPASSCACALRPKISRAMVSTSPTVSTGEAVSSSDAMSVGGVGSCGFPCRQRDLLHPCHRSCPSKPDQPKRWRLTARHRF